MEESSQGFPAAGGGDGGLGFVAAVYMGQDHIGEVRVRAESPLPPPLLLRPRPPPHSSSSSSPPLLAESQSQPQAMTTATATATTSTLVSAATTMTAATTSGSVEVARSALGSGIRVAALSPPSERCHPLVVIHTVSMDPVWLKLDDRHETSSSSPPPPPSTSPRQLDGDGARLSSPLRHLYKTCIEEAKAAVVPMDGNVELLLVAVKSETSSNGEQEEDGCFFWAFVLPRGLYASCLAMLSTRCLAMVLDLDETLILANTMRSFEDRMDALKAQIDKQRIPLPNKGMDAQKLACLTAELKRYSDDRALLKQFVDSDCVIVDNGRIITAQLEEEVMRPVIRIPERNIILTRVNPAVRDTSVLVRMRPAWEELRNHLVAKDRKRFQVYICTMSERDYAMEMWRLLDPGARLIESTELQRRLVCVKAGSKKSLSSMFEQLHCHPRMAMVIDDRPEVWEDKDQPHVHTVPAFSPYYAPQAEASAPLPVLWIARNVASNVRAGFFKYFDEVLPQKLSQVNFDTNGLTLPDPPSAANYFTIEIENVIPENNNFVPKYFPDGITGPEVGMALSRKDLQNGHAHQNGELAPAAGGWLEAEDEEQAQPDSPSNKSCEAKTSEKCRQQEHANGNDPAVLKDLERLTIIAKALDLSDLLVALRDFGDKSKTQVEFRCSIRPAQALQFSAEVFCDGIRIGGGEGKTNKEAKTRAAEDAFKYLTKSSDLLRQDEDVGNADTSHSTPKGNHEKKAPSFNAVAALRDMCKIEGSKVEYLERDFSKGIYICEVEVAGEVLGKGSGPDWESARHEAAAQALRAVAAPKRSTHTNTHKKRYSPPPARLTKRTRNGDALRPPPAPSSTNRASSRERTASPRRPNSYYNQRSRRR
ncbi:RNA polymerase II C-terminal domain phosphatase-like 2 [Selaginella moellendorffii]|uniref:RNA polymerase II C-terminal domain phosphatase-like 2 n=1 Tax=Selaginella moellendorffii TaxID=88036 RepID=UPI000D1CCF24|nr:RNA polymerase II C-terminal domain phosphatase-like 2 [Selaginella moellendorffii]|eukprot:XP_024536160.1 RNA polymerase II C-terminal domain phosphatase-like 2 [Selaginella moellendorffii]